MSELKCPICNTNLEVLVGGANALLGCPRCRDKATDGVWQELIRTRKALEIAIDALKTAKDCCSDYSIECLAKDTLEQITALEQKEVK